MTNSMISEEELTGHALLLDVALRLFVERGYDGVSMQEIATAANMTKGSPYYHFKGKEDLFLQTLKSAVLRLNQQILESLEESDVLEERLVAGLTCMLLNSEPGMIRMLEDFRSLFSPRNIELLAEEDMPPVVMQNAYRRVFEDAGDSIRVDPEAAAETLLTLQLGLMNIKILHPDAQSRRLSGAEANRIATQAIDHFLRGVIRNERG